MRRARHGRSNMLHTPQSLSHSNGVLHEQHENTVLDSTRRSKRIRVENSLNDVDNDPNTTGTNIEIKTRGPTIMPRVWARRVSVEVEFDKFGEPIGSKKNEYVEFIGTLVRNGTLIPLDYENWHKVPESIKKNLLELIKEKFTGTLDFEDVCWMTLSKNWRAWKNRVKTKYFDPNASLEENLRKRPDLEDERILLVQWKNLVIYWNRDKTRTTSAQNKGNRAQKKMMHITGKKSFSQIRNEMKNEIRASKEAQRDEENYDDGEETGDDTMDDEPSRMDLFGRCFLKNGQTSNPIVADLWVGEKVYLESVFDSKKTVAVGRLQSLDLSKRIGQVQLGENWCEVFISVAVEFDKDLIRPTSNFKIIGDAVGEIVAWPKNLVVMYEE